jgi:DamX protein
MSEKNVRILSAKAQVDKEKFKPASWLATINFVNQLVLNNNVMIAILGEQGNGKTAFAHLLHDEIASHGPEITPYRITASPLFNRAFFLHQLKELIGVEGDAAISNFIAMSQQQKSHILLIIDDAQYLSPVFIEEILGETQQLGSTGYFHVCLVSDFSLVPNLNKLAQNMYKDSVHSIELGPLSESETKQYLLQHILPRQYIEKRVTDARVKQFYQLTAGHLVDINRQMTNFFRTKDPSLKNKWPLSYVNVAAMLLVTAVAYIWYAQGPHVELDQIAKSDVVEKSVLLSQNEPAPALYSRITPYEIGAIRQEILATPLRRTDLVAMNEEDDAPNESMVVMDKVIVAPKVMTHLEKPAASPAPKIIKKNKVLTPIKVNALRPVVEQSRYTIQLLASQNKRKLESFASLHHLNDKVQLRSSYRQGTLWYVLTLGEYKQRKDANAAARKLSKDIAQFSPWVRTISDLKLVG